MAGINSNRKKTKIFCEKNRHKRLWMKDSRENEFEHAKRVKVQ